MPTHPSQPSQRMPVLPYLHTSTDPHAYMHRCVPLLAHPTMPHQNNPRMLLYLHNHNWACADVTCLATNNWYKIRSATDRCINHACAQVYTHFTFTGDILHNHNQACADVTHLAINRWQMQHCVSNTVRFPCSTTANCKTTCMRTGMHAYHPCCWHTIQSPWPTMNMQATTAQPPLLPGCALSTSAATGSPGDADCET